MGVAQLLIQHGARVIYNGVYPDVPCPLVHAVKHGSLELVRFLLDNSMFSASADENNARLPREMPNTAHPLSKPLEAAVKRGKLDAVRLLVERGANVNDHPFLWLCAVYDVQLEIARCLLQAGANINQLADNDSGETPLWAAVNNGNVELVKEFLKARADVSIRNHGGETPLGVAYRLGQKDVVYLLLRTSPHVWPRLASAL